MRQIAPSIFALCLFAAPATAQEEDGGSLMEQGMKLFMRGLMTELEPALKDLDDMAGELRPMMKDFAQEMGPALRDLMGQVQDWSSYHPPEMLPNGDIIMRKKTPDEMRKPDEDAGRGEEIEL
ncbi:hypothetical protein [Tropicibacter sp. S64]|uniref:hypothetical protein n=1 Tax=Tropicibacter sp. S64 TaxID=3415122 RepID=UPI003C7A1923